MTPIKAALARSASPMATALRRRLVMAVADTFALRGDTPEQATELTQEILACMSHSQVREMAEFYEQQRALWLHCTGQHEPVSSTAA